MKNSKFLKQKIVFREAEITDLNDLVDLGHALSEHEKILDSLLKVNLKTKEKSRIHYQKELTNENAKFVVAEDLDKQIIAYQYGFIIDAPDYIVGHEKIGQLEAGFTIEEYRGKDIGGTLTGMLVDWFKKQNVNFLELGVYAKNIDSVKVWRKLGFEDYYIKMRKFL